MRHGTFAAMIGIVLMAGATASAAPVDALLQTIRAVGNEGQGNAAARSAVQELSRSEVAALTQVLRAFDGANPLAANYLRGSAESIVDRAQSAGAVLPVKDLAAFIQDRQRDPRARTLAFDILRKADKTAAETLVPAMIDDPSPDLRREAVARLIRLGADADADDGALPLYEQALAGAVDDDQVKDLVERLKKLGRTVDLPRHFGFLTQWKVVGPFDNRERKGFAVDYPPEKQLDLAAKYAGQLGDVSWADLATTDDYGILDIAKQVMPYKGAVMYLAADFTTDKPRQVEVRLGTPNAWKIWINGRLLFAREEYHRGMAIDQYRVPAELKAGRNTILVKLCQNEQDQDWAQRYQLQLRVCDASGTAVLPSPTATSAK